MLTTLAEMPPLRRTELKPWENTVQRRPKTAEMPPLRRTELKQIVEILARCVGAFELKCLRSGGLN